MTLTEARKALAKPLVFGDAEQIEASRIVRCPGCGGAGWNAQFKDECRVCEGVGAIRLTEDVE